MLPCEDQREGHLRWENRQSKSLKRGVWSEGSHEGHMWLLRSGGETVWEVSRVCRQGWGVRGKGLMLSALGPTRWLQCLYDWRSVWSCLWSFEELCPDHISYSKYVLENSISPGLPLHKSFPACEWLSLLFQKIPGLGVFPWLEALTLTTALLCISWALFLTLVALHPCLLVYFSVSVKAFLKCSQSHFLGVEDSFRFTLSWCPGHCIPSMCSMTLSFCIWGLWPFLYPGPIVHESEIWMGDGRRVDWVMGAGVGQCCQE